MREISVCPVGVLRELEHIGVDPGLLCRVPLRAHVRKRRRVLAHEHQRQPRRDPALVQLVGALLRLLPHLRRDRLAVDDRGGDYRSGRPWRVNDSTGSGESVYNPHRRLPCPPRTINGVNIFLEEFGSGDPLVLVHGSWVDHMEWPFMVPLLSPRFRVTVYDRRGHSQSERLPTQGSIREDAADLAAIIERAGAPAHVLGISMGASISLRLAAERPECSERSLPTSRP